MEVCRQVYNYFLSQWQGKEKIPSRYQLQSQLPKLKTDNTELKRVHSKVLQMVLHQLYSNLRSLTALKKKGRKVGRLRFKGKGWFKTFTYNQSGFRILTTGKRLDVLHLSKIGNVPMRVHREIQGEMKQVIVKRTKTDKWFAYIAVQIDDERRQTKGQRSIGIDVGLKHFLTDSDGRQIENPKFYERSLKRIRVEHRKLSRKRKGSKNRETQRLRLARAYEGLVNQRTDFLHKVSAFYAKSYGLVAVEDLNVSGMARNRRLAGRILDASWGKFLQMLSYKAERAGGTVVKVNPRGTSQEYSHGVLDRDYNASLNILERGLGLGWPEATPVEMVPLREPIAVSASTVIEAGSPQPFRGG